MPCLAPVSWDERVQQRLISNEPRMLLHFTIDPGDPSHHGNDAWKLW